MHPAHGLLSSAGLWTRGGGKVFAPSAESMFFLPQKPYMPLGSLRSQLLFPSGGDGLSSWALEFN